MSHSAQEERASSSHVNTGNVFSGNVNSLYVSTFLKLLDFQFILRKTTNDVEKIGVASEHLTGQAINWLADWIRNVEDIHAVEYSQFAEDLYNRFKADPLTTVMQIFNLRLEGLSLPQYITKFDSLVMRLPTFFWSEDAILYAYIAGLPGDIREMVYKETPTTLVEAQKLASSFFSTMPVYVPHESVAEKYIVSPKQTIQQIGKKATYLCHCCHRTGHIARYCKSNRSRRNPPPYRNR